MSALPFLLDEDVPEFLADEIIRQEQSATTVRYAEELILIWSSFEDQELVDCTMYLPLQ